MEVNTLEKELIKVINKNGCNLYDFIAEHYYEMTTYQLKEVLLAVLGVLIDKCCSDEDEIMLGQIIVEELNNRDFGIDD